jgi:hypothetical protein
MRAGAPRRSRRFSSRIAKLEAADPEPSFELLLRGLFATGATRRDVAIVVEPPKRGKTPGPPPRGRARSHHEVAPAALEMAVGRGRARGRSRAARGPASAAAG